MNRMCSISSCYHHLNVLTSFANLLGCRSISRNLSRNVSLPYSGRGLCLPSVRFSLQVNNNFLKQKSYIEEWRYYYYQQKAFIMSSSPRTQTPRPLPQEIKDAKDKFLNMGLDAKRLLYRCEDNFVTLDNVLNWKEYFVQEQIKRANVGEQKYEVNEDLNSKVSLWEGDITALEIDSIVNAANSSLLGGGGVDGAIHRAAGRQLLDECRELKGCPEGIAKITGGYKLPSKYVIHTVGPQGEKPDILRACYSNSLDLMVKNQLKSIAFPCIATGVYGYPPVQAAKVALQTTREFLEKNSANIDRIIFTVFLPEDKVIYEQLMQKYFPLQ